MSDRWFFKHRQEWIGETVRIFEFINREHIERKFGISTPQASVDIQHFIDANPSVLKYNKSAKRYEAVNPTITTRERQP
jgi:hypothetical protein